MAGNRMEILTKPKGAVFTEDRRHRLYLWRRWNDTGPWLMFILLNPSTANELRNDPTVWCCIGFGWRLGYGGIFVCNLFTLVSTDPKKLNSENPVARGADVSMRTIRTISREAVAGWGNQVTQVRDGQRRVEFAKQLLAPLHCLGITKQGHPRHPLYLPRSTELRLY